MKNPWDRLAHEPKRAYNGFLCYLEQEPKSRTLLEGYRRLVENPEAKCPTEYYDWRRRFDWDGRVDAYDEYTRKELLRAQHEGMKLEAFKRGEFLAGGWREIREISEIGARVAKKKLIEVEEGDLEANLTQVVSLIGRLNDIFKTHLDLQRSTDQQDAETEETKDHLDKELEDLLGSEAVASGEETGGAQKAP